MKQKVLVSVDTEAPAGNNPVDSLIYGKTGDGREYGIRYLMDCFDRYAAKALFFVDIAEAWDYGTEAIAQVLSVIEDRGHNTGVHLHPDHMADKNRRYLWQYTYDEQYEMIAKCTERYESVLHKPPLSFRAGRYSANNDTLQIIAKLGYRYDMSQFYGNRYCKIDPPVSCNKLAKIGATDMVEVPVTVFKSFSSPIYSRNDKIDCSNDVHEFARVMKRICNTNSVDVVSFFVHSFSVLNWRRNPDAPQLNARLQKRLLQQLEWVRNNNETEFISEADLASIAVEHGTSGITGQLIDCSDGLLPYWFFFKRALSTINARMIRNV